MLVLTQINIAIPLVRFLFLYILLTICLLAGYKPTVNFGPQHNLRSMRGFLEQCQTVFHSMVCLRVVIFFKIIIYNIKTVIRFSLCDIQNIINFARCF